MEMETLLQAAETDAGTRLDAFLAAQLPELSRSAAAKLLEEGRVTGGRPPLRKNDRLRGDECFTVSLPAPAPPPPSRRTSPWTSSMRTTPFW